jgi:hypothetical protein
MDGLESTQELTVLLDRVPDALVWALCEELPTGYEIWIRDDAGTFVPSGVLDPERLRLGISRIISGITLTSSTTVFRLRGSVATDLPNSVLDTVVQAALWGEIRFRT